MLSGPRVYCRLLRSEAKLPGCGPADRPYDCPCFAVAKLAAERERESLVRAPGGRRPSLRWVAAPVKAPGGRGVVVIYAHVLRVLLGWHGSMGRRRVRSLIDVGVHWRCRGALMRGALGCGADDWYVDPMPGVAATRANAPSSFVYYTTSEATSPRGEEVELYVGCM